MPCHAMHPIQDLFFWKVFHMYYNLICIFICTPMWTKFYSYKKWVLQSNSPERAQSFEEKMSNTEEKGKVHPPPLDEDGNSIVVEDGSNTETSTAPTMEELMKQLEKLNVEVKKLKAKDKKGKNHSSSSKDDDSSFKEEVSNKGKKERKNVISPLITLCLLTMIAYLALSLIHLYPLIKLHILMGQSIINGSIA
jgi:hypothetical protein